MSAAFDSSLVARREFLASLAGGTLAMMGCGNGSEQLLLEAGGGDARLTARPGIPATTTPAGIYQITPSNPNDGVLIVPSQLSATPTPLIVALHGAGQGSGWTQSLLQSYAQSRGFLLLAPGARGLTWDVISYKYSYDVTFINSALAWTFSQCRVDPTRIILLGFSDGASYALGLAEANGDFFTRVIAASPGFVPHSDSPIVGKSQYYVSHGKQDAILNIDGASRKIVPALRKQGYDVTYVEFDGGHELPATVLNTELDWALR